MKFNPFSWTEVQPNEKIQVGQGRVRLRCSVAAPIYVQSQGVEALAGVATALELELSEAAVITVAAPEDARVFYEVQRNESYVAKGEVYTNPDRAVSESGSYAAVSFGLRQLKLAERETLRTVRVAMAQLKANEAAASEAAADKAAADKAAADKAAADKAAADKAAADKEAAKK